MGPDPEINRVLAAKRTKLQQPLAEAVMWHDRTAALLGKRVRAVLNRGNDTEPDTVAVGVFIGFGDGGDFEILEDDGFVHHCWPLLDVEEVSGEPG